MRCGWSTRASRRAATTCSGRWTSCTTRYDPLDYWSTSWQVEGIGSENNKGSI